MSAAARVEGRPFLARQQAGTTRSVRDDLQIVTDMVADGSRVLDIGCGDGALLGQLARDKNVDGRGIERSEEHTSELQSLMRHSYAVFCLKNKNTTHAEYKTKPQARHRKMKQSISIP